MDVKVALTKRKELIRESRKQESYQDKKVFLDAAESILQQIEQSRINGTNENDISTIDDALSMTVR